MANSEKWWFKMFYHEWLNSFTVLKMNAEQRGVYIQLLCLQAADATDSIPHDAELLMQLCKTDLDTLNSVLANFEPLERGRLRNDKLFKVIGDTEARRQESSKWGKKGRDKQLAEGATLGGGPGEARACIVEKSRVREEEDSIVESEHSTAQSKGKSAKEKEIYATAKEILSTFSEMSGRKFRGEVHLEAIRGRLRDGNPREDVLQALENGLRRDDLKDHWKVPASLLRPSNFEKNRDYGKALTAPKKTETDADIARETGLHVVKGGK